MSDLQTPQVKSLPIIQIPRTLCNSLKNVTGVCINIYFVIGITVFHTIVSCNIDYHTVSFLLSRSKVQILTELKSVYNKRYDAKGFQITEMHANKEFKKIETNVLSIKLQICGIDSNVPEIERSNQTQKNENRATYYAIP